MDPGGMFQRVRTSSTQVWESLSKALDWSANTIAGMLAISILLQLCAMSRQAWERSPRTWCQREVGVGMNEGGGFWRCLNACFMLGPQEPPRTAACCIESSGSMVGPRVRMR